MSAIGHEDLPEVPCGTDDQDWRPVVGALGLIVLSRDRRIRSRPAELRAYHEHGVRSVWIGAKQDLGPEQQMEIFLQHEERLKRQIVKRGPGPWAVAMSRSGVRPLNLRPRGINPRSAPSDGPQGLRRTAIPLSRLSRAASESLLARLGSGERATVIAASHIAPCTRCARGSTRWRSRWPSAIA